MNKHGDAKDFLERALDIKQRMSSDIISDKYVKNILHDIGRCGNEVEKIYECKRSLKRVLKIEQQISSDIATDRDVAVNLHESGRCRICMNKHTNATDI